MKKLSLIAVAGSLLALASCTQETVTTEGMFTQGQVDSIVDARVNEMYQQMLLENDSVINVRANELADSILAAKNGNPGRVTETVKKNTGNKTGTKAAKPTVGDGKPSMKNNDGNVGDGKPSMKDASKNDEVGSGKPSMR